MVLLGKPEEQIRQQQAQLQKHMVQLQQIQKQLHIKSIPIEQQQSLQQDLLELQRIQMAIQTEGTRCYIAAVEADPAAANPSGAPH